MAAIMQKMHPRIKATIELLRGAKLPPRPKIIELGCGGGTILVEIARRINASEIHGVDIDDNALRLAKARGISVCKADLNVDTLPYPDEYFDLVLMEEVIEHLINPDNALREARRILKRGGYFIVTTPNLAWWLNRIVLLLGYQPYWTECSTLYNVGKLFRDVYKRPGGHLRLFTLRALKQLLELHGFKVVRTKGIALNNLPGLLNIIDRILSKRPSLAQIIAALAYKP